MFLMQLCRCGEVNYIKNGGWAVRAAFGMLAPRERMQR